MASPSCPANRERHGFCSKQGKRKWSKWFPLRSNCAMEVLATSRRSRLASMPEPGTSACQRRPKKQCCSRQKCNHEPTSKHYLPRVVSSVVREEVAKPVTAKVGSSIEESQRAGWPPPPNTRLRCISKPFG